MKNRESSDEGLTAKNKSALTLTDTVAVETLVTGRWVGVRGEGGVDSSEVNRSARSSSGRCHLGVKVQNHVQTYLQAAFL